MRAIGWVGVSALLGLVGAAGAATPAVDFRLQDHRGAWHTLDEARDNAAFGTPDKRAVKTANMRMRLKLTGA